MALDFPNSPVNGQVYQTLGLTFIYNSALGKWRSATGQQVQQKRALCSATRNTGTETLANNTTYEILGAFVYNYQNLFTSTGLGGGIIMPYTGLYKMSLIAYNQGVTANGGRLGICLNGGTGQIQFIQFGPSGSSAVMLATEGLFAFSAGDYIQYRTDIQSVNIHSAPRHTEVTLEYMGDA